MSFGPLDDFNSVNTRRSSSGRHASRESLGTSQIETRWDRHAEPALPYTPGPQVEMSSLNMEEADSCVSRTDYARTLDPDRQPMWNRAGMDRTKSSSVWKWLSYDGDMGDYILNQDENCLVHSAAMRHLPTSAPIVSRRSVSVLHLVGEIEKRAAATTKLNTLPARVGPEKKHGLSARAMSVGILDGADRSERPWLVRFEPIGTGQVSAKD